MRMHGRILHGIDTGNGIARRSAENHPIVCRVEITKPFSNRLQHLDCSVHINASLVFGERLCDLDQTARGATACRGIVIHGLGGSAEINARNPIITAAGNEVICNLLGGILLPHQLR